MGLLENKVTIITGGASGIGEESVRQFVTQGAKVLICDIQDEKGQALADELGDSADYQRCDVTSEDDIATMIESAVSKYGRLDVLFNNAGITGPVGSIMDTPIDSIDFALNVLLRSVILGIKHAAPVMIKQQSGSIINTASIAGLEAIHGPHVYSAAKAGVINLTRSTATELGAAFVRVNAICPGGIATPIIGQAMGLNIEKAEKTVEMVEKLFAKSQPIPRAGLPKDIADTAVFLASEMSTFITGQAIVVDGGRTAGRANWDESQAGAQRLGEILHQVANS